MWKYMNYNYYTCVKACIDTLPDLNLLDMFIRYGVQHCIVFQVKHFVNTNTSKKKKMVYQNQ